MIFLPQYIPNDLEYTPTANPPAYTSRSLGETIKQDDHVRLKIVGTRQDQNNLVSLFFFSLLPHVLDPLLYSLVPMLYN